MGTSLVAQLSCLPKLYFLNKLAEFYLVIQHLWEKLLSSHTEKVCEGLRIMFWGGFIKVNLTWKPPISADYMKYTCIMAQSLPSTPASPVLRLDSLFLV